MDKIKPKRACVGNQRITKNYFLSILPSLFDPTYVIDVKTGLKIRIDSIQTVSQIYNLKNGLYKKKYKLIETYNPRKILCSLNDEDWEILSFNYQTREVCFSIKEKKFSYIIPK